MALNPQFKVNQLSKDMGIKSKEVIDILSEKGLEVKTQKVLEPEEFDIFMETVTKANQIENIDEYIDGVTYIPSKKKSASLAKAEEKPEIKPEVKAKEKAETETKTELKAEPKPAVKAEAKKESEEIKKAVPAAETTAPASKDNTDSTSNERSVTAPARTSTQADSRQSARPDNRTNIQNRFERTPQAQGRPANNYNQNSSAAPKGNGGTQRPNGNFGGQPRTNGGYGTAPANGNNFGTQRQGGNFGGNGFGSQQRSGNAFGNTQKGGYQNRQGQGQRGGSDFRDKGDFVQNAPREKFKVQPIIRGNTNPATPVQRGATRVVDTRGSSVDLSKFDEKLEGFASESVNELRGGNQKFKKQQATNRQMHRPQKNSAKSTPSAPQKPQHLSVSIPDEIIVSDLAQKLKVTAAEVVKKLMMMGMMVTLNQSIDYDTAYLIADEFGATVTKEVVVTIEEKLFDESEDKEEQLSERAPVVCVMGHVDHGKTSILDAIRNTSVTTGEAGGITQHIGAYRVKVNGKDITFLDTPGHEAFTAMRARGAMATDIAILVVAADDGIMPQTIEAINHAKAAGIDIIVAINKMDKPTANPDNVKQELTKYDLVPEEWGGDVICVPVSALTHQGIDTLLENVLLVAEVKELKANPDRKAKGIIIEAKLDKGRGPVATALVQNGTLFPGDIIIAGTSVGRVRAMTDHNGRTVKSAGPSVPVEIVGLSEVPLAGDQFAAVEDERMARTLADQRKEKAKEENFKINARASLNDLFAQVAEGIKELNIIVKADVGGSAEAVKTSLEKLSNEEVKVRVIHSAVGGINEGDVMFAAASNAIIIGFNVRPDKSAIDSAERQGVEIKTYRIIYECIEEVSAALKGMLAPKFRENLLGHAEVRQTIHVPGVGTIAGSYILDGKITRASQIRVIRDGIVVFEDKISSLKRFKDDVREVASGYECGVGLDKFNDIKLGDVLEAFIMEEIPR